KGSRAVEDIKKETSFQNVELRLIDLAKFVSVRSFAQKFIEEVGTLDILLANAAILPTKHESTVDGWEVALQVNHLSLSLLTLLLLPTMIETSKTSKNSPRIVMVTSQMHTQTTLDDELLALPQEDGSSILRYMSDEDMGKGYCKREEVINRRYGDTKLFGVFFARTLSDRLSKSKSNIIVNVVDPGRCVSQLIRTLPDPIRENMMTLAIEDGYTTEEGSRALVYGAVGELDQDAETGSKLGEDKLRGAHLRRGRKTEFGEFVLTEEGEKLGSRIWVSGSFPYLCYLHSMLICCDRMRR
ncbi:NAD(P)-binding protein, partial [Dendrothele bispora CBS 962.96]